MNKGILLSIGLFFTFSVQSAEYSNTVTPKGIGIYTSLTSDQNWVTGDKAYIRLTAAIPNQTICPSNAVWFFRTDKDIYSVALTAISMGKTLQLTVSDVSRVGGTVCQIVFIELL